MFHFNLRQDGAHPRLGNHFLPRAPPAARVVGGRGETNGRASRTANV